MLLLFSVILQHIRNVDIENKGDAKTTFQYLEALKSEFKVNINRKSHLRKQKY